MSEKVLPESSGFRFLGLTLSNDLSWNEYITGIAKTAARNVGSPFRARRYISPECILHLYKSLIRPCMEYCCHIWAGASTKCLSLLDWIQKQIVNIIGPDLASNLQSLSHCRDVAWHETWNEMRFIWISYLQCTQWGVFFVSSGADENLWVSSLL